MIRIRLILFIVSVLSASTVFAAGGVVKSPTGEAPDRYVYYPGTEALKKDEIRLIACGTGLPAARLYDQSPIYDAQITCYFHLAYMNE